ncbi:MAG: endonuclease/exonuclease/phosphatase family protein [Fimbriimonadales bacterium]
MEQPLKRRDRIPAIATAVCLLWTTAYILKPDFLAALTIWPFWVFAGLGVLPLLFRLRRDRVGLRLAAVFAWVVAWAVAGDEPVAIVRGLVSGPKSRLLRVVSQNCAGGQLEAAREVAAQKPDIVLFQESPGPSDLESIRAELGPDWSLLRGIDASILVRGRLRPVELPPFTTDFIAAWADIPARRDPVLIVSLRLMPPVFRLDYWNPECWTAYAQNKADRKKELAAVARFVARESKRGPVILGGDFNTPPDRTVTSSLDPICHDAFLEAGRGWGATAVNDYPMVRIDQIWASSHFKAANVCAKRTRFSDHQMTVAEFQL